MSAEIGGAKGGPGLWDARDGASPPSRVRLDEYTVIPVWYGCNSKCVICMLGRVKERLPGVDFDLFKKLIAGIVNEGMCRRLILSGGEVTTFPHLERYAEFAADLGYFETIQIQTNGRRLSDEGYLGKLVNAGVNEFFISIHGPRETHDTLSGVSGSYEQAMEGIHNLQGYPEVNVLTNTVLTNLNYTLLPALFSQISRMRVSEMHLWNFFPMEERDALGLTVRLEELTAMLTDVVPFLRPAQKNLVLKAFPECLPVFDPVLVDNDFPVTLIPDTFWRALAASGFGTCCYRDACKAKKCWGLSRAYIEKFGDERNTLSPIL